eukprot:14794487-Alexandrium_andersonii.AAC.1
MLVLFGLPDTLHPAYLAAFNAVLPDICRITNRTDAQILICAKPSCNIWHESHILGVMGIWGITGVDAGLRGAPLRWATARKVLAKGILSMG